MSMTVSHPTRALSDLIGRIAPPKALRNTLGLVTGYRAYLIYTHLSAKSDGELVALGVTRAELPGLAMQAAQEANRAA